jgi:hypothetical protein
MFRIRCQLFFVALTVYMVAGLSVYAGEDRNVLNETTGEKTFSESLGIPLQQDVMKESSKGGIGSKNILLSLVVPGLGEWVAGEKGRAKIFMSFELGLWASYLGIREYSNVLERDYHTFAAVHAGVDTRGKAKQYWIDIGNADNIYVFNEKRRTERNLAATYVETEYNFWQWDNDGNRIEYSDLRDKQDHWKQIGTFMVGGMILNRIVSAIDVIRLVRRSDDSSGMGEIEKDRRYSYLYWSYHNNRFLKQAVQLNFTWNF